MKRKWLIPMLILATLLLIATVVYAQGEYDLSWWTVDGGGETFSTGGDYSLGGAAGQHDAGLATGGTYSLAGGFWPGGAVVKPPPQNDLYLPIITR